MLRSSTLRGSLSFPSRIEGLRCFMAKGFGLTSNKKPTIRRNKRDLLKPREISPMLPVPDHIKKPPYAESGKSVLEKKEAIHNAEGIQKMKAAGNLAARVLEYAGTLVKPGVTTDEIDKEVHRMIIENNAYPSPLNYEGFPKSVCTSVNECVCHGIPDDRPLQRGDIVNIDVTVYLDGHHGDTSRMYYVGAVDEEARRLCETTLSALESGISICRPGVPYKKIGEVIEDIAEKSGFAVIADFTGHGVGQSFHQAPYIVHTRNDIKGTMKPGQTFTIEPIFSQGGSACRRWADKWTEVTKDGALTAQWEHTILITPDGHEILTKL